MRAGTIETHTLEVDGRSRTYIAHVPAGYANLSDVPVVIMLHSGGANGRLAMSQTRWDRKADDEGFLAVFPDALPQQVVRDGQPQMFAMWNDGSGRRSRAVDDVRFVAALIDDVQARFRIDPTRVFLSGFAAGASMAFRAGHEIAERIAAVGVVSGHLWTESAVLPRPVPLICLLGAEDPINPMKAGRVRITSVLGTPKPQVRDSVRRWATALGLSERSLLEHITDGVFRERWGTDDAGTEALLYIVEGLGHHWPGGAVIADEQRLGPITARLSATDVIWEFFAKHTTTVV